MRMCLIVTETQFYANLVYQMNHSWITKLYPTVKVGRDV